jgi:hypothetical protein
MEDEAFEAMMEPFDPDAPVPDEPAPVGTEDSGSEEEERDDPDLPVPKVGPIEASRDEDRAEEEVLVEEPEARGRRDLKVEATSIRHLLTHLPKNPHCPSCQQAKMRQRYSHKGAFKREIDQFGEIITCDHVVSPGMRMQGLGGEKYGLSVRDLCTGLIALYPALYNGTEETTQALKEFAGRKKIHNIYSDNAKELVKAAYRLGVEHHTSLPGEPKTNSLIERTNQIIVGGTTALLICAGLPPCFWSFAAPCFCVSYNIQGVTGESPWSLYHKAEFSGGIIPFGCLVYYKPPNTSSNTDGKWDPDARKGIFAGYVMRTVFEWGSLLGIGFGFVQELGPSDMRFTQTPKSW